MKTFANSRAAKQIITWHTPRLICLKGCKVFTFFCNNTKNAFMLKIVSLFFNEQPKKVFYTCHLRDQRVQDSRVSPPMFCLISLGFCSVQELSSSTAESEDFYAPFFTTWFCSMGTILFLPIYLIGLLLSGAKSSKIRANLKESIQSFRSKGFTLGK